MRSAKNEMISAQMEAGANWSNIAQYKQKENAAAPIVNLCISGKKDYAYCSKEVTGTTKGETNIQRVVNEQ